MRAAIALAIVLAACLPAAAQTRTIGLDVMVPTQSNVTGSLFDQYARDATDVARRNDGAGDVACPNLTVARTGSVGVEQTLPKRIDQQWQIERIRQLNTDVFVVDQLSICGGVVNDLIAGCELTSGPTILEANTAAGLTLIHEIGHAVGRHHRPQCPSQVGTLDYKNIMHCKRHNGRRWLSSGDCNAFMQTDQFDMELAQVEAALPPEQPAEPLSAIEGFLLLELPELSAEEATSALTPERLEAIRSLISGENAELWAPAAYALALAGEAEDIDLIIALSVRAAGLDTPAGFRARTMVPQALGVFAARTGELPPSAESVLLRGVDLGVAAALGVEGEAPLLSRSYALAAGLTGDPVLASAAIEVVTAERAAMPELAATIGTAIETEIASKVLSIESSGLQQTLDNAMTVPVGSDPVAALEELVAAEEVDATVVETLRGLDIEGGAVIDRYNAQVFGTDPLDLPRLDEHLMQERQSR